MERRRSNDILLAIIQSFLTQRTWRQARLAEHTRLEVRTLRSYLHDLSALGVEREEDGRDVYLSVPKNWLVGKGANLDKTSIVRLVRLLLFAPATPERDQTLRQLTSALPSLREVVDLDAVSSPPPAGGTHHVAPLAAAIANRTPVGFAYQRARGDVSERLVSPARFRQEPPHIHLIGRCHRRDALRFFRLDRMSMLTVRRDEEFRPLDPDEVEADLAARIDGYRDHAEATTFRFLVAKDAAAWVFDGLPEGATAVPVREQMRITVRTAAPGMLARYLVGLGRDVEIETPALQARVRTLAQAALASLGDAADNH